MTKWDYKGIFPKGAEANDKCFWGFRGIKSYAGNPLPAGVLDATATEIRTPGSTTITVYAINTLAYQWQQSADGANWADIEGEVEKEISREYPYAASSAGEYYFRCLCIGWLGVVPTAPVKITVRNHLPEVYIYPPSAAVTTPGELEFTAAIDYVESMQWQHSRNGTDWENIPGETAAKLTQPFIYGDGGQHQIKLQVTGLGGTADSNISRVIVTDPEPIVSITAELPEKIIVGDLVTFKATALYADIFEWQKFVGGAWVKIPGETWETYSHICEAKGEYSIRCIAMGHGGNTTSNSIHLRVYALPTITIRTDQAELIVGESATLTAEATEYNTLEWQQFINGEWAGIPEAHSQTYAFTPNTPGEYYFRCIASGDGGETISNTITITAAEPEPEPQGPEPEP